MLITMSFLQLFVRLKESGRVLIRQHKMAARHKQPDTHLGQLAYYKVDCSYSLQEVFIFD